MPKYNKFYNDIKIRKEAQAIIKNDMNLTKGIMEARPHLNYESANSEGYRWLVRDSHRQILIEELNKCGITKELLENRLKEGLNANHISDFKGKTKLTSLPNFTERRKMLSMILNLFDAFPSRKTETKTVNITIDYNKLSEQELLNKLQEQDQEIETLKQASTSPCNAS